MKQPYAKSKERNKSSQTAFSYHITQQDLFPNDCSNPQNKFNMHSSACMHMHGQALMLISLIMQAHIYDTLFEALSSMLTRLKITLKFGRFDIRTTVSE